MLSLVQTSLFDAGSEVGLAPIAGSIVRQELGRGAWVDLLPGWLSSADSLFDTLLNEVPWIEERRQMYERVVLVPRLLHFYDEGDPLPDPALDRALAALNEYYHPELDGSRADAVRRSERRRSSSASDNERGAIGPWSRPEGAVQSSATRATQSAASSTESFCTAGLCLYRDGRDSVAWHGDTIGRGKTVDTMIAIISLGSARNFLLRPRGGGATVRHRLGHGDLLVMGGSCQRTWEHAVPKTARPVGPRISIQFRPRGVR